MTPQIGCDRHNPAGRLTLNSALRYSSSTTFVASSFFLDQTSNSNGGAHAGFRMPSTKRGVTEFSGTQSNPIVRCPTASSRIRGLNYRYR